MIDYKQPWQILNIDISNAVRSDFNFDKLFDESEFKDGQAGIWRFERKYFTMLLNQEWIDKMHDAGLMVQAALLFYRKPYYFHHEAHVDVAWTGELCSSAINWTIDPEDNSEMIWYDVSLDSASTGITQANTKYFYWPNEQVEGKIFASKCIGTKPTLVNVSVAHNVVVRDRPRWCISVRLGKEEPKTWKEAVDFFKPFIVE
jgi:hypothetical protein